MKYIYLALFFLAMSYSNVAQAGQTNVRPGDTVILVAPLSDGVTYKVQTPEGMELWKDRDWSSPEKVVHLYS